MKQLTNITDEANQKTFVILDDGSAVTLDLIYRPAIQRWSMNVLRGTFEADGLILGIGANILRPWRNKIPFGIACSTTDGQDPVDISDFANGRAQIYILDAADLAPAEVLIGTLVLRHVGVGFGTGGFGLGSFEGYL